MRSLPEWTAKHDDQAIPPRVKDRIAKKQDDKCAQCQRPIGGKLRPEFDHVIPLILGGRHAEGNLRLVCNECHVEKTKLDVKLKAKIARVRKKRLGIRKPSQFACSKDSAWKKKIDGTVIPRR